MPSLPACLREVKHARDADATAPVYIQAAARDDKGMPVRVAILGASGAVGSALAAHLLRARLLRPDDALQLVGHGAGASERRLLAARIDLQDAFDDAHVAIELVPDVGDARADIVVVAAGATVSEQAPTRRDVGRANAELFRRIAADCAARLPGALFIVVSNPVELAVGLIADAVGRRRVIGMGAQQDSLRFARAVAADLGVSRHDVRASVVGEHGQAMAPLWQSVELAGHARRSAGLRRALDGLRGRAGETPLPERVSALRATVQAMMAEERIEDAYRATERALPDARIFVEPFVTAHCLHSTPNATANATLGLIAAALTPDRRLVHGQVRLAGADAFGIEGVCGVPLTLDRQGWAPACPGWLDADARAAMAASAAQVRAFLGQLSPS